MGKWQPLASCTTCGMPVYIEWKSDTTPQPMRHRCPSAMFPSDKYQQVTVVLTRDFKHSFNEKQEYKS